MTVNLEVEDVPRTATSALLRLTLLGLVMAILVVVANGRAGI
jgi:hypothetical protein